VRGLPLYTHEQRISDDLSGYVKYIYAFDRQYSIIVRQPRNTAPQKNSPTCYIGIKLDRRYSIIIRQQRNTTFRKNIQTHYIGIKLVGDRRSYLPSVSYVILDELRSHKCENRVEILCTALSIKSFWLLCSFLVQWRAHEAGLEHIEHATLLLMQDLFGEGMAGGKRKDV